MNNKQFRSSLVAHFRFIFVRQHSAIYTNYVRSRLLRFNSKRRARMKKILPFVVFSIYHSLCDAAGARGGGDECEFAVGK